MTNECLAQSKIVNLGEYVTEYTDSSDYVSSVEDNTPLYESRIEDSPFPSLTLSKKIELERYLHDGVVVSKFSISDLDITEEDNQHSCLELRSKAPQGFEESVAHKPDEVNKESVTEQEQERIPKERKQSSLEELRSESLSTTESRGKALRLDDEEQKQNQIVGSSLARLDSPLEKNGCCLLL